MLSLCVLLLAAASAPAEQEAVRPFTDLLAHEVALKPALEGVHPRVFVTAAEIDTLRERARTTHKADWDRVVASLPALAGDPPPPPGPQARRAQNDAAYAIVGASLAYVVEKKPEQLAAARRWLLAAIDYEPWGYTFNKPNVDLAAGHLLYAVGWAYDLLYQDLTPAERARVRTSLERHAGLVYDYFAPKPGKRFHFTQNHNFIPNAGLAVAALALLGESKDAPRWAALSRAHLHRALHLLSPDGYYYEGFEYWIFSAPWLVHFLDAWEHATGESLWDADLLRNWKLYVAHMVLPDGQKVFDFGDIWEGPLTRAGKGGDYARVYPGGTLQSNFNVLYRVAARLQDPGTQAVAERLASLGHSNLEEYWTLLWRDAAQKAAPMAELPLEHHFADSGVVAWRTSWEKDADALGFRAGPPEGHRVAALLPQVPEWQLESGHAHPDANTFIFYARGRYLIGDTGYAGLPSAASHNTITVGGVGQGREGKHNVWEDFDYKALDRVHVVEEAAAKDGLRVVGESSGAYPETAGLREHTRELRFTMPGTLTVTDHVQLDAPRTVEWYLHADRPFTLTPHGFRMEADGVALAGTLAAPPCAKATTGPTIVASPGPPGSIEKGAREERGFEVRLDVCASKAVDVTATLKLE
jgi:hypothetical protein